MVKLQRIDLTGGNIEALIDSACAIMAVDGHKLVATFVHGNQLVLIFAKYD